MYETVSDLLKKKQSAINSLPALSALVDEYTSKIEALQLEVQKQMRTSIGATLDKEKAKEDLIEKMLKISKGTSAYLATVENNSAYELVQVSYSALKKERDTLLAERCRVIREEVIQFINQLTDYGIEQIDIDELDALILEYEQVATTPRNTIVARKQAIERIEIICHDIDELLAKKMDSLISILADNHDEVKGLYTNARKIVNYHNRGTKLVGTVTNARGRGVQNARIEAYLGDDTLPENKIETTTDRFGKFTFEGIEAGSYEVKVFVNDVLQTIEKPDVRRGAQTAITVKVEYPPQRDASSGPSPLPGDALA